MLEIATPPDPEKLGDARETVFIFHDESTVHSNERPKTSWLLPCTTDFRTKSPGRLIHISDFILESTGRLVIPPDSAHNLSVTDAACIIYPGKNADPWWDMNQLCSQLTNKAIPIFEALHPGCQGVWVFDCSAAHEAFGPSALRVQSMNIGVGGKGNRLRETTIPSDDPNIPEHLRGLKQTMYFPDDYPDQSLAGQNKGIKRILEERGLLQYYSKKLGKAMVGKCASCKKSGLARDAEARSARLIQEAEAHGYFFDPTADANSEQLVEPIARPPPNSTQDSSPICCCHKILSLQSDFLNEKPLLQMIIEDAGHVCLFLPKFHCELNPIEMYWSFIKHGWLISFFFFCSNLSLIVFFCRISKEFLAMPNFSTSKGFV